MQTCPACAQENPRLLAAESGENAELESAGAFFARQGATLHLRRCEALLPASA